MKAMRFFIIMIMAVSFAHAQVYKHSYAVGLGFSIPRYVGSDVQGKDMNLGGHASIQANISEHSNFRLQINGMQLKNQIAKFENTAISAGFDFLYHFVPCENINPYIGLGVSGLSYTLKGATKPVSNKSYMEYQANFIFGVQWGILDDFLGSDLKIKTELAMHTVSSDNFDGLMGPVGGPFGGLNDNYFTYDAGLLYFFESGTRSKYCDLYDGILNIRVSDDGKGAVVDYNKIEDIIKRHSGQPVDIDYNKIEEIIKRNMPSQAYIQAPGKNAAGENYAGRGNWVLLGINFDPAKTTFRPEAYPILINAAQILLGNTEIKVEIEGHTDNVGSVETNKKLSQERADAVRRFLIAKGVDGARLTAVGYGSTRPIADNKTSEGKAFNRRIEFKIIQ